MKLRKKKSYLKFKGCFTKICNESRVRALCDTISLSAVYIHHSSIDWGTLIPLNHMKGFKY